MHLWELLKKLRSLLLLYLVLALIVLWVSKGIGQEEKLAMR